MIKLEDLITQIKADKDNEGKALSKLDLSEKTIGKLSPENFKQILEAMKDNKAMAESLKDLRLSGQALGDDGIVEIANIVKSFQGLKVLDLTNNDLGLKGMTALADNLKNHPCLENLILIQNPKLGTESGDLPLLALMQSCKTITAVGWFKSFGSPVNAEIAKRLNTALDANKAYQKELRAANVQAEVQRLSAPIQQEHADRVEKITEMNALLMKAAFLGITDAQLQRFSDLYQETSRPYPTVQFSNSGTSAPATAPSSTNSAVNKPGAK